MTTTIKITELSDIGANLASTTLIPVVNMSGTPTTQKTVLANMANVILAGAGSSYAPAQAAVTATSATTATTAGTVTTAAQPNITSTGTLTNLSVTGNASIGANVTLGNVFANTLVRGTTVTALSQLNTANMSANGTATIARLTITNSATLGPVGNLRISGGTNGQVLTTNGSNILSWTTVSGGNGSTGDITFTGDVIGSSTDTVNILNNWVFDDTAGVLSFPLVNSQTYIQQQRYGMGNLVGYLDSGWTIGEYNSATNNYGTEGIRINPGIEGDADLTLPADADNVAVSLNNFGNGNVNINSNSNIWSFVNNGSTIFPTLTTQRGDILIGTITGQTLLFGDDTQEAVISTPNGTANGINSQRLVINPGSGYNSGEGGDIYLWAGRGGATNGSGGDIKVRGGQGVADGTGGYIRIEGGDSQANGQAGFIEITGGIGGNTSGGPVTITGGQGSAGLGGNVVITGGVGQLGFGGGNVNIIGGTSSAGGGNPPGQFGNINIVSDSSTWTFDNAGNLKTPGDLIGPASANFTIYSNAGVHSFTFGDDGTFYAPDNVVLGGTSIAIGPGADTLVSTFANAVMVASSNSEAYIQGIIYNVSDNGSADWVAQGHRSDDTGGWADLGFTSSGFNDTDYTITGQGDGYVFAQSFYNGQAPGGRGGNLVLATGENGTVNDIIFGTGGFQTANIFGRISDSNNSLELTRVGASITFTDATVQTTAYINPSVTGNWTLATGTNTVNLSVPLNGTYSIWVNGNIPNGIITYSATAVVTNNNVPVLGSSYAWYYAAGNALVFTAIPTQFVGTVNTISNAVISTTTANVFTFGITNNSGNTAVVNWGYTKL
jgi:hypothetical protein